MKNYGSIVDYTHEREAEIMRVYCTLLSSSVFVIATDIFRQVAESPATRFWVSEDRALVVIKQMLAGKPLVGMRDNKREMFREIYRRVKEILCVNPDIPLACIVAEVVHQPAPKFYLKPRSVGEMIYKIKKKRRANKIFAKVNRRSR